MTDPLSTIVEAATAGGLATGVGTKITELAWSCGAKWISDYYANHRAAVVAKAKENCDLFLNSMAKKVNALEQESEITKSLMTTAMGEPGFSVLLQKAVLTSSQTGDAQKHEILSDLISQRLKSNSESIYAVTSQLAVDAIAHCTSNQLRILGAVATLRLLSPPKAEHGSQGEFERHCGRWLVRRFAPYQGPPFVGPLDIAHLQSNSCVNVGIGLAVFGEEDPELMKLLRTKFVGGKFSLSEEFIRHLPLASTIEFLWDGQDLRDVSLTTVGQLIGTMISDRISYSEPTSLEEWQKPGGTSATTPEITIKAMMRGLE